MKLFFGLFFTITSTLLFAQKDDLYLWKKHNFYKGLDTINTFSKNYPTKLIEGSGIIRNKRNKVIGYIGFGTEITRNVDLKLVRLFNSENHFYKKNGKTPAKTINYSTYIYFDNLETPDFAKIIREETHQEKVVYSETIFFDLHKIDFNAKNLTQDEIRLRNLLNDIKN